MPSEQRLSYEHQDIVGHVAATPDQSEQGVGMKGAGAKSTLSHRLAGDEWSDHAQNFLASRLLHEKALATVAGIPFGNEPHNRRLRKQNGWQCLL
jgi:hypothetical protein